MVPAVPPAGPTPSPAGLPQRATAAEVPPSAWAPQAPADPHPYQGAEAGQLPQRNPGVAGGPLGGPVGDFNGFTPTRQPGTEPELPRRAPGEARSPFERGTARSEATAPQAEPEEQREPGMSAFGAQRVRVPGATLTDLPDAPPGSEPLLPSPPAAFAAQSAARSPLSCRVTRRASPLRAPPQASRPVAVLRAAASRRAGLPRAAASRCAATPLPTVSKVAVSQLPAGRLPRSG